MCISKTPVFLRTKSDKNVREMLERIKALLSHVFLCYLWASCLKGTWPVPLYSGGSISANSLHTKTIAAKSKKSVTNKKTIIKLLNRIIYDLSIKTVSCFHKIIFFSLGTVLNHLRHHLGSKMDFPSRDMFAKVFHKL